MALSARRLLRVSDMPEEKLHLTVQWTVMREKERRHGKKRLKCGKYEVEEEENNF